MACKTFFKFCMYFIEVLKYGFQHGPFSVFIALIYSVGSSVWLSCKIRHWKWVGFFLFVGIISILTFCFLFCVFISANAHCENKLTYSKCSVLFLSMCAWLLGKRTWMRKKSTPEHTIINLLMPLFLSSAGWISFSWTSENPWEKPHAFE